MLPKQPQSAYSIFENKHFNEVKQQMPHLSKRELCDNLMARWTHKLSQAEQNTWNAYAYLFAMRLAALGVFALAHWGARGDIFLRPLYVTSLATMKKSPMKLRRVKRMRLRRRNH